MAHYRGAMYQQDVMEEVARRTDVVFHGPGFHEFDSTQTLASVIRQKGPFDVLVVGHAWLRDGGGPVDRFPDLRVQDVAIPKFVILNKEYANLSEKLAWVQSNHFSAAFSHHHDSNFFTKSSGVPFTFWPFAINSHIFEDTPPPFSSKATDFAFSGILQNQTPCNGQTDTRVKVMKSIFHCIGDIPMLKKTRYHDVRVAWNSKPRSALQRKIAARLGRYRFQSAPEYVTFLRDAKVVMNSISPAGLVSPRFAETMASGALVITEQSENVRRVFPSDLYVEFSEDLHDFEDKLRHFISDGEAWRDITSRGYQHVFRSHTWEIRVTELLRVIRSHL